MTRIVVLGLGIGSPAILALLKECRDVEVVVDVATMNDTLDVPEPARIEQSLGLRDGVLGQFRGMSIYDVPVRAQKARTPQSNEARQRNDWLSSLRRKAGGYS